MPMSDEDISRKFRLPEKGSRFRFVVIRFDEMESRISATGLIIDLLP